MDMDENCDLAPIAQLVELPTFNRHVAGSSPARGTFAFMHVRVYAGLCRAVKAC